MLEGEDDFGSLDPEEALEVLSSLTPLEKLRFLIERSKKNSQLAVIKEEDDTIKNLQAEHQIEICHLKENFERKIRGLEEENQRKLFDIEKRSEHEKNRLIILHDGEAAHFKTEIQRLEEHNSSILSQRDESLKKTQQFQRELAKVQDQLTKEKMEHLKTKNRLQIAESQLRTLKSFAKSFLKLENIHALEPPRTPASEAKEQPQKLQTNKNPPSKSSKPPSSNPMDEDLDLDELDFGSTSEIDELDDIDMTSSSEKSFVVEKKQLGESIAVGVSEEDLEVDNIEQFIKQTLENFDRMKQELLSEKEHTEFLERMLKQEKEINHTLMDHIEGLKQNLIIAQEETTRVKTVDMKRLQDQIKVLTSSKEKQMLESRIRELEDTMKNQQQLLEDCQLALERKISEYTKLQEVLEIVTNERDVEKKWRMEKVHECVQLSEELQKEQQKYVKIEQSLRELQKENRKIQQFLNEEFLHYNLNAIQVKRIQNLQQEKQQKKLDAIIDTEKKVLKETLEHLKDTTNTHHQLKMDLESNYGKPPIKLNRTRLGAWYEKEEGEISEAFSSDLPKLSLKLLKHATVSPTSSTSSLRSEGELRDLKLEDLSGRKPWIPLDDSKSEGEI